MKKRPRFAAMLLGLAVLAAAGCIMNYSIESPNISVVLAQAEGTEALRLIQSRRPAVVRYDWAPVTSGQFHLAVQRPIKDAVLVAGLHFRGLLVGLMEGAALGNTHWFTYMVRVYENVHSR